MDVRDLNDNELDQLREEYFENVQHDKEFPSQITNEMLYREYACVVFVKEDFVCNIK